MEPVVILLTPGGGPGILAQAASLRRSERYQARIVMADANPASGNLFLPEVDAAYVLPPCHTPEYLPALLRLIDKEGVGVHYSGLDEEIPILASHRAELEAAGCRLVVPPPAALEESLDKIATHRRLQDQVRQPATYVLNDRFDGPAAYEALGGRVVIKAASLRGGRHIYLPEDREEYDFFLRRARRIQDRTGLRFIVQELILGVEYNTTCLHDPDGLPIYAISRRKFEDRPVKSTTTAAVIERRDQVIDQALKAVQVMGLAPGFNNVESIVSDSDGQPYLIEINGGRTAAQDMNIVAAGVPMTDLLIDLALGRAVSPVPHPPPGTCILKIRRDVVVDYEQVKRLPVA
jgi:carbamoyl-phosphate synthase large subunit